MTAAVLSAFCLAGLLATSAWPRMHAGPNQLEGGHRLKSPVGIPLDGLTAPFAAYSLRKLRSAYAGNAVRLKRASDNAVLDVGFLGFVPGLGAPFNVAAANAHCASTTCRIDVYYDQSGNARDIPPMPGPALLVFNCIGGQPCIRTANSGEYMLVGPYTVAAKTSVSAVGRRGSGTGQCGFTRKGLNSLMSDSTAGNWFLSDFTSASFTAPAADNVWHAAVGVIDSPNPATLRVDATETVGPALTGGAGSANLQVGSGADATVCDSVEHVMWDSYALTAGERAVLTANQRSFWGF